MVGGEKTPRKPKPRALKGTTQQGLRAHHILIATLFLAAAFGVWVLFANWTPNRADFPVQGVSMISAQDFGQNEVIDWPSTRKAGVDFAYLVATEGSDVRNPVFSRQVAEADRAGINVGAIHLYNLCRLASDQAANFIQTVERNDRMLPSAVQFSFTADCKDRPSRDALMTEIATYLSMVEAHLGKPVLLKYDAVFEREYHISADIDRPLWLERRFLRPDFAARGWALWQSSPSRTVAGLPAPVQWSVARPEQKRQDRNTP